MGEKKYIKWNENPTEQIDNDKSSCYGQATD